MNIFNLKTKNSNLRSKSSYKIIVSCNRAASGWSGCSDMLIIETADVKPLGTEH